MEDLPENRLAEALEYWISRLNSSDRPPICTKKSISRVPNQLRSLNAGAYDPLQIEIGPYLCYRQKNCMDMIYSTKGCEYKREYYHQFLQKYGLTIADYGKKFNEWAETSLSFYGELPEVNYCDDVRWPGNVYRALMALDCCFVFELIRKYVEADFDVVNDPIFATPLRFRSILRDILLLESQLPFFSLKRLTDSGMTKQPFKVMVAEFFNKHLSKFGLISRQDDAYLLHDDPHLLGLLHRNWRPPSAASVEHNTNCNLRTIHCATELSKLAGVKFRKAIINDQSCSLFDIRFKDGILTIPTIFLEEETKSLLSNMMAFEYTDLESAKVSYVTHYLLLMNCLINSGKDVELLCDEGIINGMGKDQKDIVHFFLSFGLNSVDYCPGFFYYPLMKELAEYGKRRRNKLKAKLDRWGRVFRRDYFSSPWTLISLLAAFVLLALTLIQTLYSVFSYYK